MHSRWLSLQQSGKKKKIHLASSPTEVKGERSLFCNIFIVCFCLVFFVLGVFFKLFFSPLMELFFRVLSLPNFVGIFYRD